MTNLLSYETNPQKPYKQTRRFAGDVEGFCLVSDCFCEETF